MVWYMVCQGVRDDKTAQFNGKNIKKWMIVNKNKSPFCTKKYEIKKTSKIHKTHDNKYKA